MSTMPASQHSFSARAALLCLLLLPLTAQSQISTFSKTETIEYHDDTALWVLGQVKKVTCTASIPADSACNGGAGSVMSQTDYGWMALPWKTYTFGKLNHTLSYETAAAGQIGTIKTVTDGNNNVTTATSWKRGIPQSVANADGTTQSAWVDDSGWIRWVTNEVGSRTCYEYDPMGRIIQITYPSETTPGVCDASAWTPTTISFTSGHPAVYGLPTGHWRQVVQTGNARKVVLFDALWRPLIEENYDASNVLPTLSQSIRRYDHEGRTTFASYPQRTLDSAIYNTWGNPAGTPAAAGTHTFYDVLGRVTSVSHDSEHGLLTTLTEYLGGFQTRVTNPRGLQTVTQYQAFDRPSYDAPTGVTTSADTATEIHRDVFGKITRLVRRNHANTQRVDRLYAYDGHQQLCRTAEPETGATLMGYDAVGNLTWSAAGLPPDAAWGCHASGDHVIINPRKAVRTYDARNRLQTLTFPDGRGNQTWTYTADGLPSNITTYNDPGNGAPVINAYSYNRRRMLAGESIHQPGWYTWGLGYGYNANGHLAAQSYPTGLVIHLSPNALGQPTQVSDQFGGVYASGVGYYPNGAISQFTYGNGIVHTMTQNARQLPSRVSNGGAMDYGYHYDANGNVGHIWDHARDTGNGFYGRWMTYDALDRLTDAGSCSFGGGCWHRFTYDALDNLKSWKLDGIKDYANYVYDANNRLTNIQNTAGATILGLGYDPQGNLANRNGQAYGVDFGNRLREVPGKEWLYRYDGHGRRVLSARADGITVSQYGQAGQLLYYEQTGKGNFEQIYLGGSLLAIRNSGVVRYQHTDALGSPVAVTDVSGAVIERNDYEPYGAIIGKPTYDAMGFTGHKQDGATGLTYMQQRYYDPMLGVFLSVDPVTAHDSPVSQFHRYRYANNNPYRFYDPDGRCTGSRITNKDGTCASTGDWTTQGRGPTMPGVRTVVEQAALQRQFYQATRFNAETAIATGPSAGEPNRAKQVAATVRAANSARLGASGLAKFGVGGAASTTGAGALPGVPMMAWGAWNLRSSLNNYVIAGELAAESYTVDGSGYDWLDASRVILVGGLLPYGTLADDPGEPLYHQVILEKIRNIKSHPIEFLIEAGSIAP
jgi:RHS repeat-associated protein